MPAEGDNGRFSCRESTVERGSFGPVLKSACEVRFFHLTTVF